MGEKYRSILERMGYESSRLVRADTLLESRYVLMGVEDRTPEQNNALKRIDEELQILDFDQDRWAEVIALEGIVFDDEKVRA
jgi:hypothetical protein|tara:strand:+ start:26 stop:271 length:246 start_codon:yes stop_codon:yes gene_type:complete